MTYSFDNQPARTATIILRKQLEAMENQPVKKQKAATGLLAPKVSPMQEQNEGRSESRRVLDYMHEIRKTMKAQKDVV